MLFLPGQKQLKRNERDKFMKPIKKILVIKMEFDLVDWFDDKHIPEFSEVASTLKVISMFRQAPESFTKGQTNSIKRWLQKNSIEKFVKAKVAAEKHQALLEQDEEFATEIMWTRRTNTNH